MKNFESKDIFLLIVIPGLVRHKLSQIFNKADFEACCIAVGLAVTDFAFSDTADYSRSSCSIRCMSDITTKMTETDTELY